MVSPRVLPLCPPAAGPPPARRETRPWGWQKLLPLALLLAEPTIAWAAPTLVNAAVAPVVVPEYNAKAGYLLLFTRYVEWPANVFPSEEAPVVIGVLGANPFGDVLVRTVQGLKSQGRPLEVRLVQTAEEAAKCQVVFIARKSERDETAWLRALQGKAVLTVTESATGLASGAVLALNLEHGAHGTKVAFAANLPAAREAGLKISASMLASAKNVIRESGDKKATP